VACAGMATLSALSESEAPCVEIEVNDALAIASQPDCWQDLHSSRRRARLPFNDLLHRVVHDMLTPKAIAKLYAKPSAPPAGADRRWLRQRGFEFERLLNKLLTSERLDPRTSYKSLGEQVDGSFFLDGSVFLLEAKWQADPLPASTLYQFKGKVDGKLIGTCGVFISMSGYSKDAVDALTVGKSLNVILFDKKDIDAAIYTAANSETS
jgi:hypothetical protein